MVPEDVEVVVTLYEATPTRDRMSGLVWEGKSYIGSKRETKRCVVSQGLKTIDQRRYSLQ